MSSGDPTDPFALIGAAIVKALVAIKAGILIAAFAFVQIAVLSASESAKIEEPLKTLFVAVSFAFGIGSVVCMVLFFIEHIRKVRMSSPSR